MVVESVFTERSDGRVVVGAFFSQSVNTDLFPCGVLPKILENSIHSAALLGTQHLNKKGISPRCNIDKWQ